MSKIEKVSRGIQSKKSSDDTTSSINPVLTIGRNVFEFKEFSSTFPIFLNIHNYANEQISINYREMRGMVEIKKTRNRNMNMRLIKCFMESTCCIM